MALHGPPHLYVYTVVDGRYGWVRYGENEMPPENPPAPHMVDHRILQNIGDTSQVAMHTIGFTVGIVG